MSKSADITRDIVVALLQNDYFLKTAVVGMQKTDDLVDPSVKAVTKLYNEVFETVSKSLER